MFFGIGFYYPNQWKNIIIFAIVFEFLEHKISKKTPFLKESMKDKITDLSINFIGYYIGINYGLQIINWVNNLW